MLGTLRSSATAVTAVAIVAVLLFIACQPDASVGPKENRAPTARISGGPLAGPEGAIISFGGTGSSDPDGDALTFAWRFGDGQGGAGAIAEHAYRDNGSYSVSLIVADSGGSKDTVDAEVTVSNAAPVVNFFILHATAVDVGTAVNVSIGFSDPGSADSLTAQFDWGDQTTTAVSFRSSTLTHVYDSAGSYLATLTVRDDDGGVTTQTATSAIVVSPHVNDPPIAQLGGPTTGREGAHLVFSGRLSTDADGDSLTYAWFPGDGRSWSGPGSERRDQGWEYADNGTYTVTMIVSDPDGAADTASMTHTATNAPPVVSGIRPPSQQAVGARATTSVDFSDSGWTDTLTMTIRWGDGKSDSVRGENRLGDNLAHVYATPGRYSIQATVRDDDGGQGSGTSIYPVIVIDPAARRSVGGYESIDLGTLGGNSARPNDINDRGQIVGASATAVGTTRAFIWESDVLRDLGSVEGHANSFAHRINEAGVIAGEVWWRPGNEESQSSNRAATIWVGGSGRTIESDREDGTTAIALSESRTIVWTRWGYESHYGYVWRNDVWQALATASWGAYEARGSDMNGREQIVGIIATHSWGESRIFHAFLWEADSIRDLGVLARWVCQEFSPPNDDCSSAAPTDINENGQVVGVSTDALGASHFVLWQNGTIRDLGLVPAAPEDYQPASVLINDRGQIVASGGGQAFIWRNETMQPLGTLGETTRIVAMNEAGEVVGTSMTAAGERHVFVWSPSRGFVDLGTGPHGFTGSWAIGINARGDIIGYTAPCRLEFDRRCDYTPESRAVLWRKQ
jgi:probable HAF family extracellular repeat protein